MKKLIIFAFIILFGCCQSFAAAENTNLEINENNTPTNIIETSLENRDVEVFSNDKYFGLKDKDGNILVAPEYSKLVMVGKTGWIIQKHGKFGLMNSKGEYILEPRYRHVDRLLGRYVKIGNDSDFGIYNEFGDEILPPEYNSIDLLYGKMFLTYKNFRYGVSDFNGNVLIDNVCDDIYMPSKDVMKIKYLGEWYEIEDVSAEKLALPDTINNMKKNSTLKVSDIVADTGAISGYSLLTFSDYVIKIVSSISPAHEEAIDDLLFSHGVDTVDMIMKFSWVPKYPVTFAKKYYTPLRSPLNGPLAEIRSGLKRQIR